MREKPMTVVVVDDEPELAAKILESGDIDVVISDLLVAGGDGLKVREKAKSMHIPFVFLTGYLESYLDLLPKGSVVIEKPYDLKEVVDAISRSCSTTVASVA